MPKADNLLVCVGCKPGKDKLIRPERWETHQRQHRDRHPSSRREALRRKALRMATAETKVMIRTPGRARNNPATLALRGQRWTIARVLGAIVSGALLGFAIAWLIISF